MACHVLLPYFDAPGGNFLNIFSTPLSRFLMFLLELLESVSLELPLHSSCLVFASNRSTTKVPTLYVSVVVVASPKPPAPEPSPAPASSEPVVKRIQGLLTLRCLDGYDGNIPSRIHLGPAF